jgi:hypothetical protein
VLRLAGVEGAALDLDAFELSPPAPGRVVSRCAGRRELGLCRHILDDFASDAERLSGEPIIFGGERLGGGQDFRNTLGGFRWAQRLTPSICRRA